MEDGALRSTVKQLKTWTVLYLDRTSTPKRQVYAFSSAWKKDLREAQRHQRPVELLEGQRALLVHGHSKEGPDLLNLAWVVEFERQNRSLLALLDGTSAVSATRLRQSLQEDGAEVDLLQVSARWPATSSGS